MGEYIKMGNELVIAKNKTNSAEFKIRDLIKLHFNIIDFISHKQFEIYTYNLKYIY